MAEPWPRDRFRSAVMRSSCDLPPPVRLVAVAVSEWAKSYPQARVSHRHLTTCTGLSKSSVQRALTTLEQTGWLLVIERAGGGRSVGTYRMMVREQSGHADFPPAVQSGHTDHSGWPESGLSDAESGHTDLESGQADHHSHVSSQETTSHVGDDKPWGAPDVRGALSTSGTPDVVVGEVVEAVKTVERSLSLPRDREVEEAVDWLMSEFAFEREDAAAFVIKHAAKADHPARYLQVIHERDPRRINRLRQSMLVPRTSQPTAGPRCEEGVRIATDGTCCQTCVDRVRVSGTSAAPREVAS